MSYYRLASGQLRPKRSCWPFVTACLTVGLLFAAGCSGSKKKDEQKPGAPPPRPAAEAQQIAAARTELMEEDSPDDDELAPVSVLFVNGDAITVDDILKWIRPELEKMAKELPADQYEERLLQISRDAVRARVETQLIYQVANRRMKKPELERLEQYIDTRIRETVNKDYGGRQTRYEEALKERGLTPAEDRERIRREVLVTSYLQGTIGQKVSEPTRQELEEVYKAVQADARDKERRQMLLIDVPVGDTDAAGKELANPITRAEARKRIDAALADLNAGKSFEDVAKEYSSGINAYAGGDWGMLSQTGVRTRWQPAVDALFKLDEGQVSGVIETDDALFVVKCAKIDRPEQRSFTEMQAQLVRNYKNHQFETLTREYLADLFDKAVIRPANAGRFLRAVVEAAPKAAAD